jgi:hypothetical protein
MELQRIPNQTDTTTDTTNLQKLPIFRARPEIELQLRHRAPWWKIRGVE